MTFTVGAYVTNTNAGSLYFGRPGLVLVEPKHIGGDADLRVRVAWIDTATNVTVREPVTRVLAPWEGDTPPAVDAEVIEAATQSFFTPFTW